MKISSRVLTAALVGATCVLSPTRLSAQATRNPQGAGSLHQMNAEIEALTRRVSPSVVQIMVTGYGAADDNSNQASDVIGKRQVIGSGVIVDPEGYIITNAHVVSGAERIEILVPARPESADDANSSPGAQAATYEARIVGMTRELDLAVVKIEAHGLPALAISGSTRPSKQGELVFAFGSPQGLRNTVTMGVVSAVARQPDPESPLIYVQTDAPINPGNSGGALVNADGELVGINTFIFTTSGGNQGLGFAIPAGEVAFAYPQLLKYGHIHQPVFGAVLQTITPELAAGLHLAQDFGIVVSDVAPGGPADSAGLGIQDIILTVDGAPAGSLPLFAHSLYLHQHGERVKVGVLRGSTRMTLLISLSEKPHKIDDLASLADPAKNLVRQLSILGMNVDSTLAQTLPGLRSPSGVVVAARTLGSGTNEVPLQPGDVIHGVNGMPIMTLVGLRTALAVKKPGDAIVLQVERFGQLIYVAFTL